MQKDQKKAGIVISYMDMAFSAVIGIFFTPFAQRMMGMSEYGVYTIATAAIGYLTMLDLGFTNAMVRFTAKSRAEQNTDREYRINGMFLTFYSIIAVLSVIVGLILYFNFDGIFAEGLNAHEIGRAKIIFLVMLINTAFSFPMSVFSSIVNAYEEFVFLKGFSMVTNIAKYVAQILVLFSGFQSVGLAVAVTVVTMVSKFVPLIFCFKKLHVRFYFGHFDKRLFGDIMNYSAFVFLNIIVDQLNSNTDKMVLGALVSSGATAIYNTAYMLQSGIYSLSSSISGVFLPSLTKMVTLKKGMDEISDVFIKVGRIQFMILAFVMGGFAVFGQRFVHLWVGDEYSLVYLLVLLWLAYSIVPLSQSVGVSILQAQNKHRVRSLIYLVIAVFHVLLTIGLSKEGSVLGEENRILGPTVAACFSNLLGQWLTMNLYYKFVTKIDMGGYWKEVLKIAAVIASYTLVGGFVMHFIPLDQGMAASGIGAWAALLGAIAVYSLLFIPVAWKLMLSPFEKDMVLGVIKKLRGALHRK